MGSKFNNQTLTQSFYLLKYTFVNVPIVAGTDKFFNLLPNWKQYINPSISGFIVVAWLTLIALILLLGFNYEGVAISDLIIVIAVFFMTRISKTAE